MTHATTNWPRRITRELATALWQQPLYAIPFALFFGTLFGRGVWDSYVRAYQISLVFAFSIRFAIDGFTWFVRPRLGLPPKAERGFHPSEALGFIVASMLGAFIAGMVVHVWILPGFLGSARSIAIWFSFTLIFSALFGGISYAIHFHRTAVERARQVESVRAQLAEAELKALRAQVHPHFLFNTLNTIAALVHENPRAAEETTTRLADVFRYVLLASHHEHVRFADERAFVRDWLAIEHMRFGDRLRFEEQIEPGLDDVQVPGLVLQPLVENAVRHAVASRPEGGSIRIVARRANGVLELEVIDDGPGFDPSATQSGAGFGLHSVRERLRVAGPPHAVTIESAPGRGAIVRLTLPLSQFESTVSKGVPS